MFNQIAKEIGELVTEKNAAYGDSFAATGEFLRMLYPTGIHTDQYTDALCLVRIFDKMKRIATRKDAFGESPYRDIAGYALLGVAKDSMTVTPANVDEEHPLWLVNAQIEGLLEGIGATEDHEGVLAFLRETGLPEETVKRIHKAMVGSEVPPPADLSVLPPSGLL